MIGYYVHHQGHGHLHRMRSIASALTEPVTVLSSLPPPSAPAPDSRFTWRHLPSDNASGTYVDPDAGGTLHWAPRYEPGLRSRMAAISRWIQDTDPDLLVVDVSVEVALLARLHGVPTIVVAMRGNRSDRAHRLAYDAADALLAPWSAEFAVPDWPSTWSRKTFHTGAISRFASQARDCAPAASIDAFDRPGRIAADPRPRVLVLWGSGGSGRPAAAIAAAQAGTPHWQWRVAGVPPEENGDVWELLQWADVVITHAGQNAVAEVASARRPAVVIAEDRPHGEQAATARVLGDAGLAVALDEWPDPARWPALLHGAVTLGGLGWERWAAADAADVAADFLTRTAAELRRATAAAPGVTAAPGAGAGALQAVSELTG